jgi:microcompartment protein CcmL/EutN
MVIADREAIAVLELASIARGIVVLDGMAKRAATAIVGSRTISPGRYLIVLSSSVGEIEEAVAAGVETAKEDLVDHLILRDPHDGLRDALASKLSLDLDESLAIVETTTVSAAIHGVDRALKGADVRVIELRLGAGLSGKGVFTLTGTLHMIEAARDVVTESIGLEKIVRVELIAQPHPDLPRHLLEAEPTIVRGPSR